MRSADTKERLAGLDRLGVPEQWREIETREPGAERAMPGPVVPMGRRIAIGALALAVAAAGIVFVSRGFRSAAPTDPVPANPSTWERTTVRPLDLTVAIPPEWQTQDIDVVGKVGKTGIALLNTPQDLDIAGFIGDNTWTNEWDFREFPSDAVTVTVEQMIGGPCCPPEHLRDTPLPISLDEVSSRPQLSFSSPGWQLRSVGFNLANRGLTANIYSGPDASQEDLQAAEDAVESILPISPDAWPEAAAPSLNLAAKVPPGWRTQRLDMVLGSAEIEGVAILNTERRLRPVEIRGDTPTWWHFRFAGFQDDTVVVSIEHNLTEVSSPSDTRDTELPLGIELTGAPPDGSGWTGHPLDFRLAGEDLTVSVYAGPDASEEDLRAAEAVVASIRPLSDPETWPERTFPRVGVTMKVPLGWSTQRNSVEPLIPPVQGIALSNIDRKLRHPHPKRTEEWISRTNAWDLRDLPRDTVILEVDDSGVLFDAPTSAFPLVLGEAKTLKRVPYAPSDWRGRFLSFRTPANNQSLFIWFGPDASKEDLRIARAVVRSIRPLSDESQP